MSDKPKITKNEFGTTTEFPDGSAKIETKFGTIEVDEEGNAKVSHEAGNYEIDSSGTVKGKIDKTIKTVSISNILDFTAYTLDESDGAISHQIAFRNGGKFYLTYGRDGKLIECQGTNLRVGMTSDSEMSVGIIPPDAG